MSNICKYDTSLKSNNHAAKTAEPINSLAPQLESVFFVYPTPYILTSLTVDARRASDLKY
jgi:hypothetical protein